MVSPGLMCSTGAIVPENARWTGREVIAFRLHLPSKIAYHNAGVDNFKPGNILLVGDEPLLADFGLARDSRTEERVTETGAVMGTPSYIAPEQAAEHFGWFAHFAGLDMPASSEWTRQTLGWEPIGPGLIEDLANMKY